jgi:hypothetical protein
MGLGLSVAGTCYAEAEAAVAASDYCSRMSWQDSSGLVACSSASPLGENEISVALARTYVIEGAVVRDEIGTVFVSLPLCTPVDSDFLLPVSTAFLVAVVTVTAALRLVRMFNSRETL